MGWLDDFVHDPIGTTSNTINREVSNASNSVNRTLDDASRGDVGKTIVTQATAATNLVTTPIKTVYYGVRGDSKGLADTYSRAIGSGVNLAGGLSVNLAQNNQSFYRNKTLNDVTLGYAQDFAGFARGARTLQNDAYLSAEDRNSAIRYGVKSAAIYGSIKAFPKAVEGAEKAGSYLWKSTIENPVTTVVAGKLLSEGKTSQAISYLSGKGAFDGLQEYLPQLPNAPEELTDLFDFLNPKSKTPSYLSNTGASGTQINDPWSFSGVADSGITAQASSTVPYLLFGTLIIGTFLFLRGRK